MIKVVPFIYEDLDDLYANTYVLIDDNKGCVVIDTAKAYPGLVNYIKKNELTLKAVLLTHGHVDHMRGVDTLLETFDAPLYIGFNDEDKLIKYVRGIQSNSKIDSNALIEPSDMPGYEDKIIMASGSFTQGSSIELSCDGPLRSPYIAYQQGGISYKYGKIIVTRAIQNLLNK